MTKTGLIRIYVECVDCGKIWEGRNAHGVGARHYQKYNHKVIVEKCYGIIYEPDNKED